LGEGVAEVGQQRVPINVWETGGALMVVAAMPAVMPDDIEITLDQERLTIRAERRTEAPKDYLTHEWDYGPYERTLDLPDGFAGAVVATLGNGQLAIRVGKTGTGEDQQHQVVRPTLAGHGQHPTP
jgi:HSP20 family protein